jgi:hypothetical protein
MFKKLFQLATQPLFAQAPSSFSVESFANAQFEGKGDTRRLSTAIEEKEYNAIIEGPWGDVTKIRVEKGYPILDIQWRPNDPELMTKLGVEKLPLVRQSIFLDVTPAGGLDFGPFKNGDLNRLRDAIGLNADGLRWSFQDFIGKPAKIKVVHKVNEKDLANPYVNVTAVTKL